MQAGLTASTEHANLLRMSSAGLPVRDPGMPTRLPVSMTTLVSTKFTS